MRPIRTLIVDDEELCREGIRLLLAGDGDLEIVGESANGKEAIRDIINHKPDLVFLDIQMPEISGFDVIQSFDEGDLPLIVFVTAYDEYAVKAFEIHALDYVLKPFSKTRFNKTLDHVKKIIENKDISRFSESLLKLASDWKEKSESLQGSVQAGPGGCLDRVFVSDKNSLKVVWAAEIEWIEGADYYASLHCADKSYLYRERLKNLEERLSPDSFVRVHKSAIINMHFLDRIVMDYMDQDFALMKSGVRVKISKNRKKELLALLRRKFGLKSGG
jgi:two-component system LytT family response regulator